MAQRYNILFGGPAGSGPNILTHILGEALVKMGYYVFYSRDYQSLIRGGHNFNVLTFSETPVTSNDSQVDILVAFDELTETLHKKELKKNGVLLNGGKENMYFAGRIFKLLCIEFKVLDDILKHLGKKYDENIKEATQGYGDENKTVCKIFPKNDSLYFVNGNQGVANGAIESGLKVYLAYPMTPSTSVLNELSDKQIEKNLTVLEMENELAVANAGMGSAATGAMTMVGSSGGGIDLMTEALSMTSMAEIPLVFFLAQRPGPGTGVPTYNSQGDLHMARHAGHGEIQRVVLAPGDPKESFELTNQAFYFSQKYKIPAIIVSDKHLGESFYTLKEKGKAVEVKNTTVLGRYNSYESNNVDNCLTEDASVIKANFERRMKKVIMIAKDAKSFSRYEVYDNKNKSSKNILLSWGSTKGAILDAIPRLKCKFLHVKYIEPFPVEIEKELKGKNVILIENTSTGLLADVLREKTGILIPDKNKILRYDGRPFLADELNKELKKRLK
jgi:2-oxoglutarate/2-oxoacid ferredoxin oxidoreductase subunit alpha